MYDVCVIGQGHIGLPTALTVAKSGKRVLGVDVNPDLVDCLNDGQAHLVEPGLQDLLSECVANGTFEAATEPNEANVFIVSVPTPLDDANKPVLDFVLAAGKNIAPHISLGSAVILESTVPPGTTTGAFKDVLEAESGLNSETDFFLAHCPERVLPGQILVELISNDRVIGGANRSSTEHVSTFYSDFVEGQLLQTDATTAELVKLSENIYRDLNIALANELGAVSEELGIDVWEVISLANRHPRVNVHSPGPGVGGYCIPVAPVMLASDRLDTSLISAGRYVNALQPKRVVDRVAHLLSDINDPSIAILGTAYKGNVGDARETPSLEVIQLLVDSGITFKVSDPHTTTFAFDLASFDKAIAEADLLLILTDHDEYRDLNPSELSSRTSARIVFDTRNVIDSERWTNAGFVVHRLGASAGS